MTRRLAPYARRARPDLAIERAAVTFRSFRPPRRSWTDDGSPASTLDDYVTISVARVRWAEGPVP